MADIIINRYEKTVFILVWGVIYVVVSLKIHLPFVKLWSKFRNIKIK